MTETTASPRPTTLAQKIVALDPLPDNLQMRLADGALAPHPTKRFAKQRNKEQGQCAEHRP
ncbi:hypothetical protein [Stappia sp. ES.058]|uniref:hypothetical protein n=1 Tax=Stappia sp. ES.058 TaxID=1881061 RepID=UPI00087ABF73|nr:hypothetical protein [Stappia sp. ES.058]SDU14355.1 hypothetical protein SAMN05428979_1895 [Stappia sp. ES.058]